MLNDRLRLNIQVSAAAGFRAAVHVLVYAAFLLPFQVAMNFVFDGDTRPDLKLTIILASVFALIWLVVTFVSTFLDLRRQDHIAVARFPEFPATSFVSGLYGVTVLGSLGLIAGLNKEGDPIWMQLLPILFVALAFFAWPRTIHCDMASVSQRDLWGRKKTIQYASIDAISAGRNDGTTTILGPGAAITHTPYHADPEAFRDIVSRRSGKPIY